MAATIRLLQPDDAEALQRLRLEALEREPQAFGQALEEAAAMPIAVIRERLAGHGSGHFVAGAFGGSDLIGMIGFVRATGIKSRHKGHIWGAYVSASMRRHGTGRQLLDRVLTECRTMPGLSTITLAVAEGQTAAQALYRQAGFREYGREPRALRVDGQFIDEHLMAMQL